MYNNKPASSKTVFREFFDIEFEAVQVPVVATLETAALQTTSSKMPLNQSKNIWMVFFWFTSFTGCSCCMQLSSNIVHP